jgi:hypothetical protein
VISTKLPPPELPLQRQQYLFSKIREFVRDEVKCIPYESTDEEFEDETDVAGSEGLSNDVAPTKITTTWSNSDSFSDSDTLPPHNKCVAHLLNLIATTDAGKALTNSSYSKTRFIRARLGNNKVCGLLFTEAQKLQTLSR